jgi:hypothetical protein
MTRLILFLRVALAAFFATPDRTPFSMQFSKAARRLTNQSRRYRNRSGAASRASAYTYRLSGF